MNLASPGSSLSLTTKFADITGLGELEQNPGLIDVTSAILMGEVGHFVSLWLENRQGDMFFSSLDGDPFDIARLTRLVINGVAFELKGEEINPFDGYFAVSMIRDDSGFSRVFKATYLDTKGSGDSDFSSFQMKPIPVHEGGKG